MENEPDVFIFPQKGNVEKMPRNKLMDTATAIYRCECGSIYWMLFTDGRVRCRDCIKDVRLKTSKITENG